MTSESYSSLAPGDVIDIHFAEFTPRITIGPENRLTVEIVAGDNAGFHDTVEYEAIAIREGLVMLTWQEHIGSTIVHVLDFQSGEANTAITPARGGFMRLSGRIEIRLAT